MKPLLVDLFCGPGGAAKGYSDAGFEVVGVDINPQPDYPFEFVQSNALLVPELLLQQAQLIHASPPCQGYMRGSTATGNRYPRLIPLIRSILRTTNTPYVIENILQARPALKEPIRLCGEMFGLSTIRHRLFESSFHLHQPDHLPHRGRVRGWRHGTYFDGPYVAIYGKGGGKATILEAQNALGISWTSDWKSLCEAIPPAYTKWIGEEFLGKYH